MLLRTSCFLCRGLFSKAGQNDCGSTPGLEHIFCKSLAIREESQHAKCTICIKHKLIIKRLATDRAARQSQCLLYSKHLDVQCSDRVHYWMSRAHSKLPMLPSGLKTITLIVDGLDHQKFRYPKDLAFLRKSFRVFETFFRLLRCNRTRPWSFCQSHRAVHEEGQQLLLRCGVSCTSHLRKLLRFA